MIRQFRQLVWLTVWAVLMGVPFSSLAAEALGALTVIVKDQNTRRTLPSAQITIKERETSFTQTLETDEQGRIVVVQLNPGLYSVSVAKSGFAPSVEPSVRVVTRKNMQVEFQLVRDVVMEVVEVRGRQTEIFSSASSTFLGRETLRSAVGGVAHWHSCSWPCCTPRASSSMDTKCVQLELANGARELDVA